MADNEDPFGAPVEEENPNNDHSEGSDEQPDNDDGPNGDDDNDNQQDQQGEGNAEDPFGQGVDDDDGNNEDPFGQQHHDDAGDDDANDENNEGEDDPFGQQHHDDNGFGDNVDEEDEGHDPNAQSSSGAYRGFGADDGDDEPYTTNEINAFGFLANEDDNGDDEEGEGFGDVVVEEEGSEIDEDDGESEEGAFNPWGDDAQVVVEGDEEQNEEEPEQPKTYPEWELASRRTQLFSVLEPSITEVMEQPPMWEKITLVYHIIYFFMVLINIILLVLETIPAVKEVVSQDQIDLMQLLPTLFFTVDFLLRLPLITELGFLWQIGLDFITLAATYVILTKVQLAGWEKNEIFFFPPLRSLRFFLISRVFIRTETFRDINLALRTIEESIKSILIFICLMVIGLLLFATFVFIFERGRFDSYEQRWYRPCKDFQEGCFVEEISPFQSIPDALWLVFQVMTTVGYGDTTPTTTEGRVVTGIAIIAGVFVLAYPAMVLIGNLDQMRQDFFAQQEKIELEKAYQIDRKKILEQLENLEQDKEGMGESNNREGTAFDESHLFGLEGMDPDEGLAAKGLPADSRIVVFEPEQPPVHDYDFPDKKNTFKFMGRERDIWETRNNEFLYDPILQVLTDPEDGLPVCSNPTYLGNGRYATMITLIIDDIAAQDEATEALLDNGAHGDSFAHAQQIFALEVTLATRIPGVRMRRRCDIGLVADYSIPLVLELSPEGDEIDEFLMDVRQHLMSSRLRLLYSSSPIACGLWQKTVPITSIMLATTPFIQDLKNIAMNLAPKALWSSKQRSTANSAAKQRRNVAFVTYRHLVALVYPVYRKVASPAYCIRNVTAFTESIAAMIILHCRELRRHDIPDDYEQCIYLSEEVEQSERVYEVDVDYFRTNDWPLGTTTIEFSEKRPKGEVFVDISESGKYDQPLIVDGPSFRRDGLASNVMQVGYDESYATGSNSEMRTDTAPSEKRSFDRTL